MFLALAFSVFVSNAGFGGAGFGMGMMPMQTPFSTLPGVAEKRAGIAMAFSDGLDSKPLEQFIAAGMLPRYAPMSTDGYDTSEMWLAGLNGQTEDQVIAQAKMHYPLSAQLHHPENEELMPEWAKVVRLGLTTAPDKPASQNTQTAGVGFHPAMFGESEMEMPEIGENAGVGHGFAFHVFGESENPAQKRSGAASSGAGMTFGFGEGFEAPEAPERPEAPEGGAFGFHPAMNMFDPSEHTEDYCAAQPIGQCNYPCMNLGGICSTYGLAKAHMMKSQETSNDKGFKLTAVEVLYCLWGLTTGILVGVCYMLRTRKTASKNELAEALTMA